MDGSINTALIQDVIKQQIDVGIREMQRTQGTYATSGRFHHVALLEGQLALYVGAAKAGSIVMNLYMERMGGKRGGAD